jgi:hypothetical protein
MEIAVVLLAASTGLLFVLAVWQNRRHAQCKTANLFDEIHRELGRVWDGMDDKIERQDREISERIDALERTLDSKNKG